MRSVIESLETLGVPYMVTGSIATFCYGEPRSTNDVDIVIAPDEAQLRQMVEQFQGVTTVAWREAENALHRQAMFNMICIETAEKTDLIVLKNAEFDQAMFQRRKRGALWEMEAWIISPEDSILSKLRWSKRSHSEQQLRDIVGTMLAQWTTLDWNYLENWVKKLEVGTMYEKAKLEAQMRRELN